jgi:hypothetical protein
MKKNALIFSVVLAMMSLVAFGFVNSNDSLPDEKISANCKTTITDNHPTCVAKQNTNPIFFYDVSPRFINTITKEKLDQAKTILEVVPKKPRNKGIVSLRDVKIKILSEENKRFEKGSGNTLNAAQVSLLQATDYSTNFCIEAFSKQKNPNSGELEEQCFVYYMTVVPEKKAEFKKGHTALLEYLKENSQEKITHVTKDRLKSGKLYFTVTKEGRISNVKLDATSGYSGIDKKMFKLIENLPGEWEPATNSKGEKVDQKLVFSFGEIGC